MKHSKIYKNIKHKIKEILKEPFFNKMEVFLAVDHDLKVNQSTEVLTRVDFINNYLKSQHVILHEK